MSISSGKVGALLQLVRDIHFTFRPNLGLSVSVNAGTFFFDDCRTDGPTDSWPLGMLTPSWTDGPNLAQHFGTDGPTLNFIALICGLKAPYRYFYANREM